MRDAPSLRCRVLQLGVHEEIRRSLLGAIPGLGLRVLR